LQAFTRGTSLLSTFDQQEGLTLRQTFAKERVLMRREMRKQLCNSETMQIDAYAQVHAAEEVKVVLEFLKSEIVCIIVVTMRCSIFPLIDVFSYLYLRHSSFCRTRITMLCVCS
jgi:hypothetical protein